MTRELTADVVVLGGGPAGLAAALASRRAGAQTLLIEREARLGGILKQCIHDGFGLVRYKEKLTGPEYALRDADAFREAGIDCLMEAFVIKAKRTDQGFALACTSTEGITRVSAKSLVLATGCRERTDRQVFIHGDRPAGIYTAGLAQYMVNIQGILPGRKAVILGSGDIGLIMARRLVLEGVEVLGAFELKDEPSGLSRNIRQCLIDYGIPLELSTTVTAVSGKSRVEAVTVAKVDPRGKPVPGTEKTVPCDCLILSVGLIPENEIATSLGVEIDPSTRGPFVDHAMHTLSDGIFACGNAVHVNDLVDYVSESGEIAGASAAAWSKARRSRSLVPLARGEGILVSVPQFYDMSLGGEATAFFRSSRTMQGGAVFRASALGTDIPAGGLERKYRVVRPPEMERVSIQASAVAPGGLSFSLTEGARQNA